MAAEPVAVLALLQHADSFFPSGSSAHSWGLETLTHDSGNLKPETVLEFVRAQLLHRWATFDRLALVAAFDAHDALDKLARIDHTVEAMTLAAESRDASRRSGAALLRVHLSLGTANAQALRDAIDAGRLLGHLTPMQGALWCAAGLDRDTAQAASAHGLAVGLLGAAIRLGLLGHLKSQAFLQTIRDELAEVLRVAPAAIEQASVYVPQAEIAMMRHESQPNRLFAT